MKELFDQVSAKCSKMATQKYSTSFSLGISLLSKRLQKPIYGVYGFVRFADEIVDSFHGYEKEKLLKSFKMDTYSAIANGISLNPILNSFQDAVNQFNIERELIESFFNSMEMDLASEKHSKESYEQYILGSAEVVGLMCLRIFLNGNEHQYNQLKPYAMRLGSAFQKVNFLRDAKQDYEQLGRTYFPGINMQNFANIDKQAIEKEIEEDFDQALIGIKMLPKDARKGVYLAYVYYRQLFNKIKRTSPQKIMQQRIRIANIKKAGLMFNSLIRHQLNML